MGTTSGSGALLGSLLPLAEDPWAWDENTRSTLEPEEGLFEEVGSRGRTRSLHVPL